ncbi:hypothetical protein OSCI_3720036 [Kamptonema sp. PCC 6506]|nr:hypothetical protein OSCI_3720036 [Kamptonema sp. PCC 6506]
MSGSAIAKRRAEGIATLPDLKPDR